MLSSPAQFITGYNCSWINISADWNWPKDKSSSWIKCPDILSSKERLNTNEKKCTTKYNQKTKWKKINPVVVHVHYSFKLKLFIIDFSTWKWMRNSLQGPKQGLEAMLSSILNFDLWRNYWKGKLIYQCVSFFSVKLFGTEFVIKALWCH